MPGFASDVGLSLEEVQFLVFLFQTSPIIWKFPCWLHSNFYFIVVLHSHTRIYRRKRMLRQRFVISFRHQPQMSCLIYPFRGNTTEDFTKMFFQVHSNSYKNVRRISDVWFAVTRGEWSLTLLRNYALEFTFLHLTRFQRAETGWYY
jgi:hypothetical protein